MTGKTPKKKERAGVDRMGRTPLHYAALEGELEETKRLLAVGADPNARDDDSWTPLHFAAKSLHADVARLLLSSGAEVDAQDSNGNTPLLNAVFAVQEDPALIRVLLAAGADRKRKNKHGVSPLSLARDSSNPNEKKWLAE